MPALVANYRKHVVETRLKKFYSVFLQAIRTNEAENGGFVCDMITSANNPDEMLEYFNVNYGPYMKTVKVEKLSKGVAAAFPDGSGMYIRKNTANFAHCTAYTTIAFCVDYKKCENIDETKGDALAASDGKDIFGFNASGNIPLQIGSNITRQYLIERCSSTNATYCSSLIAYDSWVIKDDYPIKF
jgi:hypothetical protein